MSQQRMDVTEEEEGGWGRMESNLIVRTFRRVDVATVDIQH